MENKEKAHFIHLHDGSRFNITNPFISREINCAKKIAPEIKDMLLDIYSPIESKYIELASGWEFYCYSRSDHWRTAWGYEQSTRHLDYVQDFMDSLVLYKIKDYLDDELPELKERYQFYYKQIVLDCMSYALHDEMNQYLKKNPFTFTDEFLESPDIFSELPDLIIKELTKLPAEILIFQPLLKNYDLVVHSLWDEIRYIQQYHASSIFIDSSINRIIFQLFCKITKDLFSKRLGPACSDFLTNFDEFNKDVLEEYKDYMEEYFSVQSTAYHTSFPHYTKCLRFIWNKAANQRLPVQGS